MCVYKTDDIELCREYYAPLCVSLICVEYCEATETQTVSTSVIQSSQETTHHHHHQQQQQHDQQSVADYVSLNIDADATHDDCT